MLRFGNYLVIFVQKPQVSKDMSFTGKTRRVFRYMLSKWLQMVKSGLSGTLSLQSGFRL